MRDFELLVQRIESLGVEVNILGDLNCNVAACPLELHTKKSSGTLRPLPVPPAD